MLRLVQSNAGGGVWYGNSKTIQGLASNTFRAINSPFAFTVTHMDNYSAALRRRAGAEIAEQESRRNVQLLSLVRFGPQTVPL
jgi:hypothetical protein